MATLGTPARLSDDAWWSAVSPLCHAAFAMASRLHSCCSPAPGSGRLAFRDVQWSRADVSRLDAIAREAQALVVVLGKIAAPRSRSERAVDVSLRRGFRQLARAARLAHDAAWITVEIRVSRVPVMPLGGIARQARLAGQSFNDATMRLALVATYRGETLSFAGVDDQAGGGPLSA